MKSHNGHQANIIKHPAPYTDYERSVLAHYESAARAICKLRGLDEDEQLETNHPTIKGATVWVKRWETCVNQLEDFEMHLIALTGTSQDRHAKPAKPA